MKNEQYLYLMICDRCKEIRDIPDEMISSLANTKGVQCSFCSHWNIVPLWLRRAIKEEKTK